MKKVLFLTCLITTSLVRAMENKFLGCLDNDESQRKWLKHHMKTHKQGYQNNPIIVWDEVKKKHVKFSLNNWLSLQMERGKIGLNSTLLKRSWDITLQRCLGTLQLPSKKLRYAHAKECFVAQLTKECRMAVFWELKKENQGIANYWITTIDVDSKKIKRLTPPKELLNISKWFVTSIALSRTKDMAFMLQSDQRVIILNPDATLKKIIPSPKDDSDAVTYSEYEAIDFSRDGSMLGIRYNTFIATNRWPKMVRRTKIINISEIPDATL